MKRANVRVDLLMCIAILDAALSANILFHALVFPHHVL